MICVIIALGVNVGVPALVSRGSEFDVGAGHVSKTLIRSITDRLVLRGGGRTTKAVLYRGCGGNSKRGEDCCAKPSIAAHAREVLARLENEAVLRMPVVDPVDGVALVDPDANELEVHPNPIEGDAFSRRFEHFSFLDGYDPVDIMDRTEFLSGEEGLSAIYEVAKARRKSSFIYSDFANVMSVHQGPSFEGLSVMDCYGSPFCGLTAIDVGCRVKPNVDGYELFCLGACDDETVIDAVGTSDFLIEYAAYRGFNLAIRSEHGVVRVENPVPGWKWIMLDHLGEGVGHYRLLVAPSSSGNNFDVPIPPPIACSLSKNMFRAACCLGGFFALGFCGPRMVRSAIKFISGQMGQNLRVACVATLAVGLATEAKVVYEAGEILGSPDNTDVRPVVDRRDPVVVQDTYRVVNKRFSCRLWLGGWHDVCSIGCHGLLKDRWLVSTARSNQLYSEMQALAVMGKDPTLALAGIARLREVNTDSRIIDVLYETAGYLREISSLIAVGPRSAVTPGLIAYNADPRVLAPVDVAAVAENQLVGGLVKTNYVLRAKLSEPKMGVPIAVCPVGCLITEEGVLTPGLFCVTDQASVFSAVVARGMVKDMSIRPEMIKYVNFSKRFIDHYIRSTPVPTPEEDVLSYYRERNRGKKTAKVIERDVLDYQRYTRGEMTRKEEKKFTHGKIFTKFESNVKESGGMFYSKPRAIMMMSPKATVELNQLCTLFDSWNSGDFGKFQVKHMTQEEVVDKVCQFTDRPHAVTDFSSFESSIIDAIRDIERHAMIELMKRSGYHKVLRDFLDFEKRGFDLDYAPSCYSFSSRCSGHYWTSFANGVVNVTLAAYLCYVKELKLDIIAEGDDGIVPLCNLDTQFMELLGFKISSEMSGNRPGDNDFLRSRWVEGKRYINVGRVLSGSFWVRKGAQLRPAKQKYILRCMAMSVWNLSPGHPVLWAFCKRVFRLTSGSRDFKGSEKYLNHWGVGKEESYTKKIGVVEVDESMRSVVAEGGNGFPPITVGEQLWLEEQLLNFSEPDVYIGRMLNDYPDIVACKGSMVGSKTRSSSVKVFAEIVKVINSPIEYVNIDVVCENKPGVASVFRRDDQGVYSKAAEKQIRKRSDCVKLDRGWDTCFKWVEPNRG